MNIFILEREEKMTNKTKKEYNFNGWDYSEPVCLYELE